MARSQPNFMRLWSSLLLFAAMALGTAFTSRAEGMQHLRDEDNLSCEVKLGAFIKELDGLLEKILVP